VELQKRQADADVQSLTGETKQLNRNSIELEMLRDELERIDTATERVGNMVESINVELNAPSRVRSIEVADTPRRQPDQRLQATGVVGVGVFGMIALVISVLEFRSRRVGSPEEVIKALPLPIIGTLPVVPSSGRLALPIADDQRWQHVLIESVDALRTLLIRARQVEGIRSVMITSALGGEGKTSLASHLAISLARAGLKTLLIDCDLRRPAMHRLFELPAGPGVTEVLGGGVPFEDAVQSVAPLSGLGVLTAGGSGYEAAHLLAQPAAHDLFAWARKTFDFVVVDTAPVLPVADTLLIGQHVDVAIFSILREVSRLPGLQAAQERLSRVGIRLLGAVVTGVRGDYFSGRYYE
jgi:capsular exopolysaccharide synthesis family protein